MVSVWANQRKQGRDMKNVCTYVPSVESQVCNVINYVLTNALVLLSSRFKELKHLTVP